MGVSEDPTPQPRVLRPAPSSQSRGGPGFQPRAWGRFYDLIISPESPIGPTTPGWAAQGSPGRGWRVPLFRPARPLTFTFPASRRPSHPTHHQRAPPRGEARGGRGPRVISRRPLPCRPRRASGFRAQSFGIYYSLRRSVLMVLPFERRYIVQFYRWRVPSG